MSLLDRSDGFEPCTVYPEVVHVDSDGNKLTKASATGIETLARFQIQGQAGTSARRAEQQDEGFESERVYTVRFARSFTREHGELGAQSVIVWGLDAQGRPARYSIFGDVNRFTGSRRTRHVTYNLRRS